MPSLSSPSSRALTVRRRNPKVDPDGKPHPGGGDSDVIVQYSLFRFVMIFDHFKQVLDCWEFCPEGEASQLPSLLKRLASPAPAPAPFFKSGEVESSLTRSQFEEMVQAGIRQCHEGEVFQVVYSRHFEQAFTGDDFQGCLAPVRRRNCWSAIGSPKFTPSRER